MMRLGNGIRPVEQNTARRQNPNPEVPHLLRRLDRHPVIEELPAGDSGPFEFCFLCGLSVCGYYKGEDAMTEDSELLRRYAQEGSGATFAELVQRHINLVYASALRRVNGNTHLAEDVTQNVFTALARAAPRLLRHTVLAGWLHTTTRNAAAQTVRTERRRLAREQDADIMHQSSAVQANDPDDWERLRPLLDEVLDELDESDRDAILLRFFEGRSFAEVGEKLQLAENTARMRVDRALDKMNALLARRGVASTVAALGLALTAQAGVTVPA
jgi:RNA polymerase sigma factor (sigma-70 family)